MKVHIVAGNAEQAKNYRLRKFKYVRDVKDLHGVRDCLVMLCGTYWTHPEYHDIKLLLSRLSSFSNVEVRLAPVKFIFAGSLDSARLIAKKLDVDNWYWATEPGVIPSGASVVIGWDFGECRGHTDMLRELDVLGITDYSFINPGK